MRKFACAVERCCLLQLSKSQQRRNDREGSSRQANSEDTALYSVRYGVVRLTRCEVCGKHADEYAEMEFPA